MQPAYFDYEYRIHASCTLHSFLLFEFLLQRPSLLRLDYGCQIVYKKGRTIDRYLGLVLLFIPEQCL